MTRPRRRLASFESGDAGAELFHCTGGFAAGDHRQGGLVQTFAKVNLNEVDADGLNANEHLPGAWLWDFEIDKAKNFGSARGLNLNCFHDRDKHQPKG